MNNFLINIQNNDSLSVLIIVKMDILSLTAIIMAAGSIIVHIVDKIRRSKCCCGEFEMQSANDASNH